MPMAEADFKRPLPKIRADLQLARTIRSRVRTSLPADFDQGAAPLKDLQLRAALLAAFMELAYA